MQIDCESFGGNLSKLNVFAMTRHSSIRDFLHLQCFAGAASRHISATL